MFARIMCLVHVGRVCSVELLNLYKRSCYLNSIAKTRAFSAGVKHCMLTLNMFVIK